MPGYLLATILLGFPFLELVLLIVVGGAIGGWVFALLLASATAGWMLIKAERTSFAARMHAARRSSTSLLTAVAASGRTVIAGVLLILPGLISDVAAILLLLWPRRKSDRAPGNIEVMFADGARPDQRAADEGPRGKPILEGEFRRLD